MKVYIAKPIVKLIYQVFILSIIIYFLIHSFVLIIYKENYLFFDNLELIQKTNLYLGLFHIQVNVLIAIYFLVSILFQNRIHKMTNKTTLLALMSYSILTIIIFFSSNLVSIKNNDHWKVFAIDWIIMTFQQIIIPLSIIVYCFIFINLDIENIKNYIKKNLILILIYPTLYIIFILIKSKINWEDHLLNDGLYVDLITNKPNIIQIYTYEFFAFHLSKTYLNISGWLTTTIAVFLFFTTIIISFISFSYLVQMQHNFKKKRGYHYGI